MEIVGIGNEISIHDLQGCEARSFPLHRYAGSWTGVAWMTDPKGSPANHSPSTHWTHCSKANVDCYRTIFSTRCQPAAHLRSAGTATIHEMTFIKVHCVKKKKSNNIRHAPDTTVNRASTPTRWFAKWSALPIGEVTDQVFNNQCWTREQHRPYIIKILN